MSSMGMNPGTGDGGGLIQSVYGYSDLGKTFSDDNLTDTFNAYTINKLADRLSVVESGAITSVDWGIITGKPTTLAGYGITDAYTKAQADGKYVALAGAQTITGIKTFTGHIMLGGSSYSSINHVFNSDTSSYLNMGFWSNTNNVRVASIGYWNTSERIILNPIGSADPWENTVGKYNFIVGRNELTYNTYNILHTGNYTGTLDGRYVKKSGDAMTGTLQFSGALNVKCHNYGITAYAATGSSWEGGYKYYNTAGSAQLGAFGAYGSSNALNYLYIGKSYEDTWLKVTGGAVVPLVVRSTNATGQVIQVCDASGTGAELGWYTGIGAYIQNDRLSSKPTLSLGGVDSLLSGLRFRYSGNYYDVWHGGNLPKTSLWAGDQHYSHALQANVYTPYQFISTFLNNDWAGFARRGSWDYANNGQITTDWGNMHLAGTAYMAWGRNKTRTMLFITPSTRSAGADLTNEMMFYTCNEPNETYPSRWTRVLTSRNYNKYSPTLTGGGASGTWSISVSGYASRLQNHGESSGNNIGKYTSSLWYWSQWNGDTAGIPATYMCGINARASDANYGWQLGHCAFEDNLRYRKFAGGNYGSWRTIACLDNNVASATKLQTARYLWGRAFDGTGNVTGSLESVAHILPGSSGNYNIGSSSLRFQTSYITGWYYSQYNGLYIDTGSVYYTQKDGYTDIRCSGNEICFGSGSTTYIHVNYRKSGGANTPNLWYWRAGSSSSWANFNLGSLTANGNISATGSVTGYSHYASEWYRSTGAYGWYNNTYSGGIYMNNSYWIKTYGKPFYSGNARAIGPSNFNVNIKAESASHAGIEVSSGNYTMGLGCHSNGSWYWWRGTANPGDVTNKSYCMQYNGSTWSFYGILHTTVGMYTDGYASALGLNTSSDMRLKNKVRDITIPVRAIAEAPSFEYTWKSGKGGLEAGSSAQYWLNVVTPCVNANPEGYYAMRYGQIALLSCISISKELLKSIGRVESLEDKVKRLERENRELLEFKRKVEQRLSA